MRSWQAALAISLGGDSDTHAAITGGVAHAVAVHPLSVVAESLPMLMLSTTLMLTISVVVQGNTWHASAGRVRMVKARDVVIDKKGIDWQQVREREP